MEPLPYNYYHRNLDILRFYTEIYGTNEVFEGPYLLRYAIETVFGNGNTKEFCKAFKKRPSASIDPVLLQLDITDLPSGNYNLVVDVMNREMETLSTRKIFFQRSNPDLRIKEIEQVQLTSAKEKFTDGLEFDDLEYSIRALLMNVPDAEVEVLNIMMKEKSLAGMRQYLFSYWHRYNPVDPQTSYEEYMAVARAVDRTYQSGFRHGFETDRGWMFMKYGKPSDVVTVVDEPSAPPYEIWVYYEIDRPRQNNVKFLFYNPSLGPGDFLLLHSTARGELTNPNWEAELYRDAPQDISIGNGTGTVDIYRRAREFFSDF